MSEQNEAVSATYCWWLFQDQRLSSLTLPRKRHYLVLLTLHMTHWLLRKTTWSKFQKI